MKQKNSGGGNFMHSTREDAGTIGSGIPNTTTVGNIYDEMAMMDGGTGGGHVKKNCIN
jgi:hypothetical protein